MSDDSLKLTLFSQSTFPSPISSNLLASSPALDLTATVTNGNLVAICRAGGELVASSSEKQRVVRALCWKADGMFCLLPPTVRADCTQTGLADNHNHDVHQANSSQSPGATARRAC